MAKIIVDGKTIIQLVVEEHQRWRASAKANLTSYGAAIVGMKRLLQLYLCDEAERDLINGLTDTDPFVRRCVVFALGCLVPSIAVEPLLRTLSDPDPGVRRSAARELGHMKDERAVAPLLELLKGDEADMRQAAASSLAGITGKSFVFGSTSYDKWRSWIESHRPELLRNVR